jgi:3-carboxy-cis,cis-muconate cycloisomerase
VRRCFLTIDSEHDALLSPGTVGSSARFSDVAVLRALVDVENAYLRALVEVGIAPSSVTTLESIPLPDPQAIARDSRETGNPIMPLVAYLRSKSDTTTAHWIHAGATSQDIIDSALMVVADHGRAEILTGLSTTIASLSRLADEHRSTVAAARTLTQHSTPTTWGLRFATWLGGVLDARDAFAALSMPVQLGGASGTLAALVEFARAARIDAEKATAMPSAFANQLGLTVAAPWHTTRAPVTRLGGALCGVTDALGVIGSNVAIQARTEIGELREPWADGRGASSAMPQKKNPILSVLLRANALRAPALVSTLHLCAANAVDERPDGAWHAEWPTVIDLLRLADGSTRLAAELTAGLTVDEVQVAQNLALTGDGVLAERASISGITGSAADYLGASNSLIDAVLARAHA